MNETQLTELLKLFMQTPRSNWLWSSLGEHQIQHCPEQFRKPAGAGADLCFLEPNGSCLLVENKLKGASLGPRQKLLYLNHFLSMYARNPGLVFQRHVLVILTTQEFRTKYSHLMNPEYHFNAKDFREFSDKSHLRDPTLLSGHRDGDNTVFQVSGSYKHVSKQLNLRVKLVALNDAELSQINDDLANFRRGSAK